MELQTSNHSQLNTCEKINDWQISQVRQALQESDAGDFATESDVLTVIGKWQVK